MARGYRMTTRSGHDFYEMASLMQKGIRRGDYNLAGFAAYQLMEKYHKYMWKRLLIISAEDCFGVITKEIVALQQAAQIAGDHGLFAAKAIVLLCQARKNRDADFFACMYMHDEYTLDPNDIEGDELTLSNATLPNNEVPDFALDCHTYRGKRNGKTRRDMIADEGKALHPKQMGLFDNESWEPYFQRVKV